MQRFPVFVVGSPRSGTSVLTSALLGVGYAGYNEGNFLSLLNGIEKLVDSHFKAHGSTNKRALTSVIDPADVKLRLYGVIRDSVADKYSDKPWLDKTGTEEMIAAIPTLMELWPGCRFIFAKRRGIENIVSRLKKFPQHPFQQHCISWSRTMAGWRKMREQLPDLPAIEIDQREIAEIPELVSERIAGLLELTPEQQARMTETFTKDRPQETEQGSASRVLALRTVGWTQEEQDMFRLRCTEQMRLNNYTMDNRYWREPPPGFVAPAGVIAAPIPLKVAAAVAG
jgi:Sulfotransferase family